VRATRHLRGKQRERKGSGIGRRAAACSGADSYQGLAGWLRVLLEVHGRRRLHEEARKGAFVQAAEERSHLRRALPPELAADVGGLGDELHVAVLDAVVHHLDVVARAAGSNVPHARKALGTGARPEASARVHPCGDALCRPRGNKTAAAARARSLDQTGLCRR
jgi:hypothetical protein